MVRLLELQRPRHLLAGYTLALPLAALAFTPLLVMRVEPRGGSFWPVPTPLYAPYLGVFFYFVCYSVKLLAGGLSGKHGPAAPASSAMCCWAPTPVTPSAAVRTIEAVALGADLSRMLRSRLRSSSGRRLEMP